MFSLENRSSSRQAPRKVLEISLTERCPVTLNRNEGLDNHIAESADRRQFLRNAVRIGGAAALLLTGASRELLAKSLALNAQEMEAARQARQVLGAPSNAEQDARRMEARTATAEMRGGCAGGCEGDCKGCSGACTHSCSGDCLGGCSGGCKGACAGGCKGGCEGTCQGTGVG